ncbi:MAG: DUF4412 domain-containing protein [Algicola sp.]|nr:DUF4412 domain-containing protein [Algicola sp.]
MKVRVLIPTLICFFMMGHTNAQFLKKLKKKAKEAVERTVLERVDKEVSKGTDNSIDSLKQIGKGNKNGSTNIGETEKNLNTGPNQPKLMKGGKAKEAALQKKMAGLMRSNGMENVPDVYEFSYRATMKIITPKEETEVIYLFEPKQKYFGNTMNDSLASNITVMDIGNKSMVMFSDNGKQKSAMKIPMGNKSIEKITKKMAEKGKKSMDEAKVVPIEGKIILGYQCEGYQITAKEGVTKIWITNETPVGYLGGIAQTENLPDTVLPIGETTMFMEMQFKSSKGKKNNYTLICTELKEESLSLIKEEYAVSNGF